MFISDILKIDSIVVPLNSMVRESAIASLVDALKLPGASADIDALKAAVLAREAAGSTGIGNGVAIPHARSPRINSPRLAVGKADQPIDFNSADGKPVTLVFLLAVPAADPTSHLKILAALSRVASDKKLLRALNKAESPQDFLDLVEHLPV